MSTLTVKNLTYVYGEGTPFLKKAVDNVSFDIKDKSITGIIGHTGSGKSTLVQMVNGILKPKSGEVLLDGENIYKSKKSLYEARFKIGLVFQYPEYQLFDETVRKDMAFGPKNMGLSGEEIEKRIIKAAEITGLSSDLLDKSPFELSGGQKRRAAIAGVMVMMPQVLILDEPASGLDPIGRKAIFEALLKYRESVGATVIIISHSMEDMAKYAEDIIVLKEGRIIANGSAKEVFGMAESLGENALSLPEITRVILALQKRGIAIPSELYTVNDTAKAIYALYREGEGK